MSNFKVGDIVKTKPGAVSLHGYKHGVIGRISEYGGVLFLVVDLIDNGRAFYYGSDDLEFYGQSLNKRLLKEAMGIDND